tara:strand:+ start:3684 stop:4871 length:1188 start_codon:yes stop_codon:yes gene_type:complete
MALPTLEWTITDEQLLGLPDPDWAGMSNDGSSKLIVNFLSHIARHITDNSTHWEVNSSAFNATDGTVVIGLKTAGGQRLGGLNIILGGSTENQSLYGAQLALGGSYGLTPHNISTASQTKSLLWMAMTIGMDEPEHPNGVSVSANDWRTLDWEDNSVVAYANSNPRFSGFTALTGNTQGNTSDAFGIRLIESAEALFFMPRATSGNHCWLGGCGAIIDPQDTSYAEVPGTGGWTDSAGSGVGGENNRVFGITSNPVNYSNATAMTDAAFWVKDPHETHGMFTSNGDNNHTYATFKIFDPLAQDTTKKKVSRMCNYSISQQYGGDLTTPSGTRVHLDIPLRVAQNPNYFLGRLRQIRAGQDSISGTILKNGAGVVKSILWSISGNAVADAIAFDNE